MSIPKSTRLRVLQRSGGHCEDCGWKRPLELHRVHYATAGNERPGDFQALCRDCHRAKHVDCNCDDALEKMD